MARTFLLAALAMAAVFQTAAAVTYTVGATGSWDLQTNYTQWVTDKRFFAGDRLVFKYSPSVHDVLEVTKAAYDACSTDNEIKTYNSGNDDIPLTAAGTRYFLCGFPNHCAQGMKLQVDVLPSSSAGAPAGAPGANAPPPRASSSAPAGAPGANAPSNPASAAAPGANSRPPTASAATSVKAAAGAGLGALVLGVVAAALY